MLRKLSKEIGKRWGLAEQAREWARGQEDLTPLPSNEARPANLRNFLFVDLASPRRSY